MQSTRVAWKVQLQSIFEWKKTRRIFILRLKLNNSRWKWREWNTKECESYFIQVKLGWIMYFYLYSTTSSIVVVIIIFVCFVFILSLCPRALPIAIIPHSTAQYSNNALSMENSFVEQTTTTSPTKSGKKFLIMSVWLRTSYATHSP